MKCSIRKKPQKVWNAAITIALLAVMLVSAQDLAAQRPASLDASGVPPSLSEFSGSWAIRGRGFDEAKECAEIKNALGDPAIRCSIPFDKVKSYLHPRALAWLKFVDERMSTKWYCSVPSVPVSLDGMVHTFDWVHPGELQIEQSYYFSKRSVWMDGRGHPPASELFDHGHSVGWFEGDDLVIETTNFTFDPDGFEDHTHLPSSQLKKVTERYKKVAPDKLQLTITHEDPLFLKKPYTWSKDLVKVPRPETELYNCERDTAQRELELTAPNPYEGK